MSAVDLLLPRCSLPTGHRCDRGSRARRFERLTPPEDARPATPAVVLPAQKKPRTKAGFDGLPAPLTGAANASQELTTPCCGDMSMIYCFHNTGSVHDMHLSDAVTFADRASRRTPFLLRPARHTLAILAAAGLHALRGRS